MLYCNYVNGEFVEDVNGNLPMVTWSDVNNNAFRAIMHTPDFVELRNHVIRYIYLVQLKPVGIGTWINLRDNNLVVIDNNHYMDMSGGNLVEKEDAVDIVDNGDGTTSEVLKTGYARQYDFFIDSLCKGVYGAVPPIYHLMMKEIAKREGVTL